MRRDRAVSAGVGLVLLVLLVVSVAGCVDVDAPDFDPPDFGADGTSGDTATFTIDGGVQSVTQSGTVEVSGYGEGIDYAGPLGCAGQYFTMSFTEHIDLFFHYTAVDALLAWGSGNEHHFAKPPVVEGKDLVWRSGQGSGGGEELEVRVRCPLPSTATEPLLAPR